MIFISRNQTFDRKFKACSTNTVNDEFNITEYGFLLKQSFNYSDNDINDKDIIRFKQIIKELD